ncbi:hypothetical protein [Vibrio crassostreae]|uniref:hypothetical protein n=1 Tax=Vibrio crassostreae TaxID=246167 RepID=UPI0010466D8B|nr:hypothetical protein [Vibrio crassostreae]TCW22660.1 hypothetical protein EDB48_101550 [Vibrio crassostreae]
MSELHNNAEAFVLCALAEDTSGNHEKNQDIGTFLMSLILAHKKGQLNAVHGVGSEFDNETVKTGAG